MPWQDKVSGETAARFVRLALAARHATPNAGLPDGIDVEQLNTALLNVAAAKGLVEILGADGTSAQVRTTVAGQPMAAAFVRLASGDVVGWPALTRAIEAADPDAPASAAPGAMVAQIWSRIALFESQRPAGYERRVVATPAGQAHGVVWFPGDVPPSFGEADLGGAFEAEPPGGPVLFVAWHVLLPAMIEAATAAGHVEAQTRDGRPGIRALRPLGDQLLGALRTFEPNARADVDALLAVLDRLAARGRAEVQ